MDAPSNPIELEAKLRRRAATDSAFRQELLTDPRAAIERELGVSFPAGITIKAVEETPDTMYIVVPPMVSGELSDADLDIVAGGDPSLPIDIPGGDPGWNP